MDSIRTILGLRLDLLEKDIGATKKSLVHEAINTLTLEQLNKLRNVTHDIADEILAVANEK